MTEVLVRPADSQQKTHSPIEVNTIDLHIGNHTVKATLKLEEIDQQLFSAIPNNLLDLLQIAFLVYIADRCTPRGTRDEVGLGKTWYRKFRFVVPVYNIDLWTRSDVQRCLIDTLHFLSEDDYIFDFVERAESGHHPPYLRLGYGRQFAADHVALFSGGLDSLSGIVDLLSTTNEKLVLVSHRAAPVVFKHMQGLRDRLRDRFPGRVHHVPVLAVQHGDQVPQEYSQRTRSFLYSTLGTVVAQTFGAGRIALFENGIVSLHLPISAQVLGARATRTTHPAFIGSFNKLVGLTTKMDASIQNPFIWQTKSEVIQRLVAAGGRDLIEHALSCSSVLKRKSTSHCGCCSQCVDRRFAELKANIDLSRLYAVDLLTGERKSGPEQTMAESYVRTYQEIDQSDETAFFTRYGGSIADVLNAHPVGERENIARLIFDIHQRQAATVLEVLTKGIRQHSSQIARGQLPSSCVLMLAAATGDLIDKSDHQATEHQASPEPDDAAGADLRKDYEPTTDPAKPIVMLISKAKQTATIKSCTDLSLRSSKLILTLKPDYDSSLREQLPLEKYQTCSVNVLTDRLQVSDGSLRHQVAQLRREHREAAEIQGMPWARDAIIQNIHGRGYRLNPMIRFENAD